MLSAKPERIPVPLSAEEDSMVIYFAQTLFPMNSAATVIGKKKIEKNEASRVLVVFFFLAAISVVTATAKSSGSRLQQKLNMLLCRGSIQ